MCTAVDVVITSTKFEVHMALHQKLRHVLLDHCVEYVTIIETKQVNELHGIGMSNVYYVLQVGSKYLFIFLCIYLVPMGQTDRRTDDG